MNDWAEFRHFKYLLAIAEHKGFRAAAEYLHTAQPNLSAQAKQFQDFSASWRGRSVTSYATTLPDKRSHSGGSLMLRLSQVIKPWKESAALNSHINLYGFWNQTAFLTKSGDLGMVLHVGGVDYESLDHAEQEYAVKRLEAALKAFGPGFHVYQ